MCFAPVWYVGPTVSRPRSSAASPAFSGSREPVAASRPAAERRAGRVRAAGDDDLLGGEAALLAVVAADADRVWIDEARVARDQRDAVSRELVADDVDVAVDHVLRPPEEVMDRDLLADAVALAVQAALAHAREVEHGLAQRLRGNRARVRADAADHVPALDHGHAPPELRGLDGRLLPSRTGADDDEIEVELHACTPFRGPGVSRGIGRQAAD